jgi:hypothetical protein
MVAEWEFAGGWSLGVMPGVYRNRDEDGRRFVGAILAAVVGKSLNDRARVFLEVAGEQIAAARHGGCVATADVGIAYLLTRDVQVDAAISRGLNRNAPDFAWTIGLSTRF